MFLSRVIPLGLVLGITGCTSADILRLDPTPRPQTSPESIQLLGREPQRPYTVIAIVSARREIHGDPRVRLIREAAHLGGHAVLFDISSMTRVGGDESERLQLTGKVIVYTDSTQSH